jgi:hypothetical protein
MRLPKLVLPLILSALLAACADRSLTNPPVALGDFGLGLNIVVADNMEKVPISRDATPEEWEAALQKAIDDRFGRYEGTKAYNLGISVDGYALAPPGIPIIASPKSVLAITANIWDDAAALKLNEEGEQLIVFESLSGEGVIGSGLTRTREEQMEALAFNAAYAVEEWLVKNRGWFGPDAPVQTDMIGAEAIDGLAPVEDVAAN